MNNPFRRTRFPSPARQRRRIIAVAIAVPIIIFVAVELIIQVVVSGRSVTPRNSMTWSAAVAPILSDSGVLSHELAAIRQSGSTAKRVQLDELVSSLVSGSVDAERSYQQLTLRAPSPNVGALANEIVTLRLKAARGLQHSINLAIATGRTSSVTARATAGVASAGRAMEVADRDLVQLQRSLPVGSRRYVHAAGRWIMTASMWSQGRSLAYVAALEANPSLRAYHRLRLVAVSVVPPPLGFSGSVGSTSALTTTTTSTTTTTLASVSRASGTSGVTGPTGSSGSVPSTSTSTTTTFPPPPATSQIPPASAISKLGPRGSLSVIVVIANAGNVSVGGTVTAKVTPTSGTATSRSRATVAETVSYGMLAPNGSRYLRLRPIALRSAGTSYHLDVTASGTGGASAHVTVSFSVAS